MLEVPAHLIYSFKQESFDCVRCHAGFNHEHLLPIRLLCGHSACLLCLQPSPLSPTAKRFRVVTCPLDNTTTTVQAVDILLHKNQALLARLPRQNENTSSWEAKVLQCRQALQQQLRARLQCFEQPVFRVIDLQIKRLSDLKQSWKEAIRKLLFSELDQELSELIEFIQRANPTDVTQHHLSRVQHFLGRLKQAGSSSLASLKNLVHEQARQLLAGRLQFQSVFPPSHSKTPQQRHYNEQHSLIEECFTDCVRESALDLPAVPGARSEIKRTSSASSMGNSSICSMSSDGEGRSLIDSFAGETGCRSLIDSLSRKYQLVNYSKGKETEQKTIAQDSKLKPRLGKHYNSGEQLYLYSRRMKLKRLKASLAKVQYLGHTIQLMGHSLQQTELACFFDNLQWDELVESLKLVKVDLTDAGLNTLLNFVGRAKNLESLNESLWILLCYFQENRPSKLLNIYLGQNFVPRSYKALAQLRELGLNIYV